VNQQFRIPAFPAVRLCPKSDGGEWLSQFVSLHGSGRAAVYWAFRGLGLPPGTTAWTPSYHCGVEVSAAMDAGYTVNFYDIARDLTVDEDDLRRRIASGPGPVLLVHYFGFPQPRIKQIAELCMRCGCTLIEDCAHALFSSDQAGHALGSTAPVAIHSLRKSLPLVDGGALSIAGPHTSAVMNRFAADAWRAYWKAGVRMAVGARLTSLYRTLRWGRGDSSEPDATQQVRQESYRAPMSWLSRRIAAAADPSAIVAKRRRNYHSLNQLLASLPEYRPVWPVLPAGTCPLLLAVRVTGRTEIMRRLASRGVEGFRFGASSPHFVDPKRFPHTAALRDSILGLPIHQDLGLDELEYIALAFREATALDGRCCAVQTR